jgi:hypothetical protein
MHECSAHIAEGKPICDIKEIDAGCDKDFVSDSKQRLLVGYAQLNIICTECMHQQYSQLWHTDSKGHISFASA